MTDEGSAVRGRRDDGPEPTPPLVNTRLFAAAAFTPAAPPPPLLLLPLLPPLLVLVPPLLLARPSTPPPPPGWVLLPALLPTASPSSTDRLPIIAPSSSESLLPLRPLLTLLVADALRFNVARAAASAAAAISTDVAPVELREGDADRHMGVVGGVAG